MMLMSCLFVSNLSAQLKVASDIDQKHYGFIAQDVQKLFPELVKEDGSGYLSVNYVELIPILVNAVQELSAKVEEQDKQIKELQAK